LTLFQFQSTKTYTGPFRIDTTQLPANAIESQTETGKPGKPETRVKLNMDYEFEIVLRLASKNETSLPESAGTPQAIRTGERTLDVPVPHRADAER